jgi:hypothetical protein
VNAQPLDVRAVALKQECLNQFQNCGYTALTFTIWLRFLRWIKLFSLFAPVVLGALATWNIVGESMPAAAAVCAFLAVLIPRHSKPQNSIPRSSSTRRWRESLRIYVTDSG